MIPIIIEETSSINRVNEPVSMGLPFPKGLVHNISGLHLLNHKNRAIPLQANSLATWSDKSLKWALLDFQVTIPANKIFKYTLLLSGNPKVTEHYLSIAIMKSEGLFIIDTGAAKFFLSNNSDALFKKVELNGYNILQEAGITLIDKFGKKHKFLPKDISLETAGELRTTFKIEGHIKGRPSFPQVDLFLRINFFAGTGLVKLECTIRNPRRAKHPQGFWDLGDKGSIYFKDLSVYLSMAPDEDMAIEWIDQPEDGYLKTAKKTLEIYQDSSGGINWNSPNHVNRFGKRTGSFRGYRVFEDGRLRKEEKRASPVVLLKGAKKTISGVIKEFWQNFPKAIEIKDNSLVFRLFPSQYKDVFELQGGEQKTHTVFLCFGEKNPIDLRWVHRPLMPKITPEWFSNSMAFNYLIPREKDSGSEYIKLIESAVEGNNTLFDRLETIDEYGWRNFGDLYADHETLRYKGPPPLISHYNNQYDILYGTLFQYVRSGNLKWQNIADNLARHVIDIDIYHTSKDKPAYNGGLFWHTMHYTNAATATHRCYTRQVLKDKNAIYRNGGGPANEHNYTSGLLYYYYLTGNRQAKEAVLGLAKWVISMDDGAKTGFRSFDRSDTGLSSRTAEFNYHGPGRGAGNSINALIDAYFLTKEKRYIIEAEKLIKRCIHPKDDLGRRNLNNPEKRWSYLVFLQVLGKYLDTKTELDQKDYMYCYARESLLHYARWMIDNEYIYLEKPEKLEYPTATWAAQEMCKTNVFLYAAKYRNDFLRNIFLEKAKYFYTLSLKWLLSYKNYDFLRPIAILLSCGSMYSYFEQNPGRAAMSAPCSYDFGLPRKFTSQCIKVKRKIILAMFFFLVISITSWMILWLNSK